MSRLKKYIDDYEIMIQTLWEYQRQFYHFSSSLSEMFDKDVFTNIDTNNKEYFKSSFNIGDDEWIFEARHNGNYSWGIAFYSKLSKSYEMYKPLGGKNYTGSVFAGVFRSIKTLLNKQTVNSIYFNTDDSKLKSLYKRISKWIPKRFTEFSYEGEENRGSLTQFTFTRNNGKK